MYVLINNKAAVAKKNIFFKKSETRQNHHIVCSVLLDKHLNGVDTI